MPYDLTDKLVIGLASSALFDLEESDAIFRTDGPEAYQAFQRENQNVLLKTGVAFPFIKRLLSLNELNPENPPIEVVLLTNLFLLSISAFFYPQINLTRIGW